MPLCAHHHHRHTYFIIFTSLHPSLQSTPLHFILLMALPVTSQYLLSPLFTPSCLIALPVTASPPSFHYTTPRPHLSSWHYPSPYPTSRFISLHHTHTPTHSGTLRLSLSLVPTLHHTLFYSFSSFTLFIHTLPISLPHSFSSPCHPPPSSVIPTSCCHTLFILTFPTYLTQLFLVFPQPTHYNPTPLFPHLTPLFS